MAVESIIPYLPDWIFFLIIIIVIIVIYKFLPDDLKEISKNFLKAYGFWILLLLFIIYFWNKWGYVRDHEWIAGWRYAAFLGGLVALLYFGVSSWIYEQRYYTNHFIANNIHGSCHRFQEIGNLGSGVNWVVFFLDGSGTSDDRFVFPWPWVKRVVVVPKVACQFIGNQILAKSQVERVDLYDLPEDVKNFVEKDTFGRWCKDNIYFGLWSVEIKATDPKYSEVQEMVEKTDSRINEQDDMLKGKLTRSKVFISDTMAMTDKLKGKSIIRRRDSPPTEE